jgi:hypothetical protein
VKLCKTIEDVASAISLKATGLIAIDGFQASGKTTLAKALSQRCGFPVVSADDYLNRNMGSFFAHLRLEELSAALQQHKSCIFEGICCLKILEALGFPAGVLVYVKRMAIWGWADEDELPPEGQASSDLQSEAPDPVQVALQSLWAEVAQYHRHYRPHQAAGVVYERCDA